MSNNYNYTLSEVLKTARTEKKIALDQVELDTKIRKTYITALENGKYDELPADIYVRGILENYSDYLDLNYSEILKLYRKEGDIQGINLNEKKNFLKIRSFMSSFVITNKLVLGIIFIILMLGISSYIYNHYEKLLEAPELTIETPINFITVEESPIYIKGSTEKNIILRVNGQQIPVDENGNFKEDYYLKEGKNIIIIDSISNKNKKITTIKREVNYKPPKEVNLTLELEVINDTWIEVEIDGENILAKTILVGEKQIFEANLEIKIRSQNGQDTFVKFNNNQKEALGENNGFTEKSFKNE